MSLLITIPSFFQCFFIFKVNTSYRVIDVIKFLDPNGAIMVLEDYSMPMEKQNKNNLSEQLKETLKEKNVITCFRRHSPKIKIIYHKALNLLNTSPPPRNHKRIMISIRHSKSICW